MLSNHSDSGVSGSHMNDDIYTPYPSPPPYPTYDQPDMSGRGGATAGGGGAEQMDCSSLPADISGLHLGQRVNSFSNLNCNSKLALFNERWIFTYYVRLFRVVPSLFICQFSVYS